MLNDRRDGGYSKPFRTGLFLCVPAAGLDTGITASPVLPLHLHHASHLDCDTGRRLGRLTGADCLASQAGGVRLPKHRCSLLTAEEWSAQPCHARRGRAASRFVMPHVKHLPQIPFSLLRKHDETAVGDALKSTHEARGKKSWCPDDLLIKSSPLWDV